jgi:hypothetical protein
MAEFGSATALGRKRESIHCDRGRSRSRVHFTADEAAVDVFLREEIGRVGGGSFHPQTADEQ